MKSNSCIENGLLIFLWLFFSFIINIIITVISPEGGWDFRLWGIFLLNQRILSQKNNEPLLAMTVTTITSDRPNVSLVDFWKRIKKLVFFCKKENSALFEHTCLTNHTIGWDKSKIITTNWRYHQRLCLEAWHINSANTPLNCDDGS